MPRVVALDAESEAAVEGLVERQETRRLVLLRHDRLLRQIFSQLGDRLRGHHLAGAAHQRHLDRHAHETRFGHLLGRDLDDEGAALRADADQPRFAQLDEGFAHRLAADAHLARDLVFRQRLAGGERHGDDGVAQFMEDPSGNRLSGDPGGARLAPVHSIAGSAVSLHSAHPERVGATNRFLALSVAAHYHTRQSRQSRRRALRWKTEARARLSGATLGTLPKAIQRPGYDRSTLKPGIVHLGIGAFHRAHQAVTIDDGLAADPNWAIVAASLRSAATRDALKPQDGLYTLSVRSGEGEKLRIIGSVLDVIVATEERERLLAAMSDPGIRIVSLTVTEKGYCHDPATGALNEADPGIMHDLAAPQAPETAPGLIVEALARRRAAGVAPFTVLTCDNLPSNGTVARRILTRYADLRDADLGAWVAGEVAFPSTMVDRITPATTDEDRARVDAALGVTDAWPVVTEPFSQWVIEDHFPTGRPAYEAAGGEMVADVAPYEQMKLRLLNGAHSSLSYLGYLGGYEFRLRRDGRRLLCALRCLADGRGDADSGRAALDRPCRLQGGAARPLPQSGAEAPHLADLHGRQPEAAAAAARHYPRLPEKRCALRPAGAGRCRLDALRHRHRRERPADRRARSVGRRSAQACRRSRAECRTAGACLARRREDVRLGPCRRSRAS